MNDVALSLEVLSACLFAWILWLYHRRVRRESVQSLEHNVRACQFLWCLLQSLQQHRAYAAAFLAGDSTFADRRSGKAEAVASSFRHLRELARQESRFARACFDGHQAKLLEYRWRDLLEQLNACSVEQSIAAHAYLVEQVLRWLAGISETRLEARFEGRAWQGLVRCHGLRLPQLSECLGQAAALGLSVAVRGACAPVARVRLMYLAARAESLLKALRESCEIAAQPGLDAAEAVRALLYLIRTQMLLGQGIRVMPMAFLASVQAVDDALMACMQVQAGQLLSRGWAERPVPPQDFGLV